MFFGTRNARGTAVRIGVSLTNPILQIVAIDAACGFADTGVGTFCCRAIGNLGVITRDAVGTAVRVGVGFAGTGINVFIRVAGELITIAIAECIPGIAGHSHASPRSTRNGCRVFFGA